MEIAQLITLIGMGIILAISCIILAMSNKAAKYAELGYRTMKDPKTYIILSDEKFVTDLYADFSKRLINDAEFTERAKEAVTGS